MARFIALAVIAVLTGIDQIIKYFIERNLSSGESIVAIDRFIQITYLENTGAAFGSFKGGRIILIVITALIVVAGLTAILLKKIKPGFLFGCAVMVIAGGLGNLIDRIARGYVIDYLDFIFVDFAVFNFADCMVTCGAALIIAYLIRDLILSAGKGRNEKNGIA